MFTPILDLFSLCLSDFNSTYKKITMFWTEIRSEILTPLSKRILRRHKYRRYGVLNLSEKTLAISVVSIFYSFFFFTGISLTYSEIYKHR